MAGQVARPRLVAHQGVRRSAPATTPLLAKLQTTQRLPQGYDHPYTSATWSTSPQSRPSTPIVTRYNTITYLRQWSNQQCSPTWSHQRGRSPSLHLKTDHA